MKVRIYIMPRKEVLDPQGKAIISSLRTLGFTDISDVRQGKLLEIMLNQSDREQAEIIIREICTKLLVNEVIEDYSFEIIENI